MPFTIYEERTDVRMEAASPTIEGLFQDSAEALFAALEPQHERYHPSRERHITVEGRDAAGLLVEFLNELLRMAHAHKEVYLKIEFTRFDKNSLDATLEGVPVEGFHEEVKAVTHHEAEVRQNEKGGWEALILFDR